MVQVVFVLAGIRLAVPGDSVAEIVFEPRLVKPAGAPAAVAGVMDLRGWLVPVVRLARLFGLADPPPSAFRPLIVLRRPQPAPWAVMVEAVADVVWVEPAAARAVPVEGPFAPCVSAVFETAEGLVQQLDPDRLLDRREAEILDALRDSVAERWKEFGLDDH